MAGNRGCLGVGGLLFVTGGLAGAAVALLLAPQSGRKSREQLLGYARRAQEHLNELADTPAQVVDQAVEMGRDFMKDKAIVTEAVQAGRTAMQWERERLSEKTGEKNA